MIATLHTFNAARVIFCKHPRFFAAMANAIAQMHPEFRVWWGDQVALAELVKRLVCLKLPTALYNCTFNPAESAATHRLPWVLHFKGNRKQYMRDYLNVHKGHEIKDTIPVYLGYDPKEAIGTYVFMNSAMRRSSAPLSFHPLALTNLRGYDDSTSKGTNDFIRSRFLIPYLQDYQGYASASRGCGVT